MKFFKRVIGGKKISNRLKMLFTFIILIVVANGGLIYADGTENNEKNLFTQSEDDLPEDSVNTSKNSTEDIININNENINNINQKKNQIDNDSSTSDSIDSNSKTVNTNNDSNYNSSESNNSGKNLSETNSSVTSNIGKTVSNSSENILATFFAFGSSTLKFTSKEISSAASELKKYVEKYSKLPDYLILSGEKISMSNFLYLLSKYIVNANDGNSNFDVTIADYKDSSYPNGGTISGNLYKSGYVDLAKRIILFMDNNNEAPKYGSSTLGNIQFQTVVYGFAKIVNYFDINKVMLDYISFDKSIFAKLNNVVPKFTGSNGLTVSGNRSSNPESLSLANIKDAGARVEAFVKANEVLPNYVTIVGKQYSMTDFLYLASATIVNINKGITSNIIAKTFKDASKPGGNSIYNDLYKNDYVDLASRVSNYMLNNGQAPNYASSTLGNIQFQTLVLSFSKILEFANNKGRLPNYLTLSISSNDKINGGPSNSSLAGYLKATKNCQVTNANIQALSKQLTSGLTTDLAKATVIFNYLRDKISYSFYYNTAKGAVETLTAKSGNCVDQTHLLTALLRASGIAIRYVNGETTFSSGKRHGHVWAEVYIDEKWIIADATSSKNTLGTINNWNRNTASVYGKYAEITF